MKGIDKQKPVTRVKKQKGRQDVMAVRKYSVLEYFLSNYESKLTEKLGHREKKTVCHSKQPQNT